MESRGIECFIDIDDLGAHYFDERLFAEITKASDFIVIPSPGALQRCRHEGDWLRREITHAIETERNIIPILKDGFTFPPAKQLPPMMREFPRYNCIEYSHKYFNAMVKQLISFLREQQQV